MTAWRSSTRERAGDVDLVDGGDGVPGKAIDFAEETEGIPVEPLPVSPLDLRAGTVCFEALLDDLELQASSPFVSIGLGAGERRVVRFGVLVLLGGARFFEKEPRTGERSLLGDNGGLR
jgi:hypothetical protein